MGLTVQAHIVRTHACILELRCLFWTQHHLFEYQEVEKLLGIQKMTLLISCCCGDQQVPAFVIPQSLSSNCCAIQACQAWPQEAPVKRPPIPRLNTAVKKCHHGYIYPTLTLTQHQKKFVGAAILSRSICHGRTLIHALAHTLPQQPVVPSNHLDNRGAL